jgi:hypothetical protein
MTERPVALPPSRQPWGVDMMTPQKMRLFALDCLRAADLTDDASHQDLMVRIARTWLRTASAIEHHRSRRKEWVGPDLRPSLD